MRAFSWPDAFPATDLGIRKALGTDDERKILAHAETWRPVARLCCHAPMENADMTTFYTTFESPVGPLLLMSDGQSLTGLHTDNDKHRPAMRPDWIRDDSVLRHLPEVKAQLRAYFDGRATEFDLPLAPQGTEFQIEVWRELCNIPYGETISYAELARRIGRPTGLARGRPSQCAQSDIHHRAMPSRDRRRQLADRLRRRTGAQAHAARA